MMVVFGPYAQFYDMLYEEKDYLNECDFLEGIFARYSTGPIVDILDLGCGTGGHALPLAKRGYEVTGIDQSEAMLAAAKAKASSKTNLFKVPLFRHGDIRNLDLGTTFDAVVSMFAVFSYLITNEDLSAALRTARYHLKRGGLLVFDAWFGPGVFTERPTDRCKVVESNNERILRFAHPTLNILQHTVDVQYHVLRMKGKQILDDLEETHTMRFLFPKEVEYYLDNAGFHLLRLCPFLRPEGELGEKDWNLAVVAAAI